MNRIFGFFKEKLIEAKEQNQGEIHNIVSALQGEVYSKSKMLASLQQIKTNYLQWNIMIANEASTGLYFSQIHNKTCVIKKARAERENEERDGRNQIILEQMQKTLRELREIEKLNRGWVNGMSGMVGRLGERVAGSNVQNVDRQKQFQLISKQGNVIDIEKQNQPLQVLNQTEIVQKQVKQTTNIQQELKQERAQSQLQISKRLQIQSDKNQ